MHKIVLYVLQHHFFKAVICQKLQAQIIAYKGCRRPYFGITVFYVALGSELGYKQLKKLGARGKRRQQSSSPRFVAPQRDKQAVELNRKYNSFLGKTPEFVLIQGNLAEGE